MSRWLGTSCPGDIGPVQAHWSKARRTILEPDPVGKRICFEPFGRTIIGNAFTDYDRHAGVRWDKISRWDSINEVKFVAVPRWQVYFPFFWIHSRLCLGAKGSTGRKLARVSKTDFHGLRIAKGFEGWVKRLTLWLCLPSRSTCVSFGTIWLETVARWVHATIALGDQHASTRATWRRRRWTFQRATHSER